ncbi:MAG: phytoene/squalene synthase family protein [Micrococcales bacterium]
MTDSTKIPTGLALYTKAAETASNEVIRAYSTSFGMAVSLLGKEVRQPVRNIYALVRVADEIVDGAAEGARQLGGKIEPGDELTKLENEVYEAIANGFSSNIVVHAFALTAKQYGFGKDLVEPFFYSMRQDLKQSVHDEESFKRYVYGSAEVVGLMCLAVFIKHSSRAYSIEEKRTLVAGARALGSAFQKVNFLRDLAADFKALGRSYFPGITVESFSEAEKNRLVDDIESELATARQTLSLLPKNSVRAVAAAELLFAELNRRIERTPANELISHRISVPNFTKVALLIRAVLTGKG